MAITQHHGELVGRSIVDAYERSNRGPDDVSDPRVAEALWRATMEAMQRLSAAAADETLLDVRSSYSYKASLRVSVDVTLLAATDQRLWIARSDDGLVADPLPVAYEAVRPVGKTFAGSVKVEQGAGGVTITGGRDVARWLESLQTQRPEQPAAWLTTGEAGAVTPLAPAPAQQAPQVPPAWHPDPSGRHQFRWWGGTHWTEHVSDNGMQSIDPPT